MPAHTGTTPTAEEGSVGTATGPGLATCCAAWRPRSASRDWFIVHLRHRPGRPVDGWRLRVRGDVLADPAGPGFAGVDGYGRFAWVPLRPGAREVCFEVLDADGVGDGTGERRVDPATAGELWLRPGDPAVRCCPPADAVALPPPADGVALPPPADGVVQRPGAAAGSGVVVVHYRPADGDDGAGWGLHVWDGARHPTDWAAPLRPARRDSFGLVFEVPLAQEAGTLSYLPHRGQTKDPAGDRRVRAGGEVWVLAGVPRPLLPVPVGADGPLDVTRARAHWLDRRTVAWDLGPVDSLRGRVHHLLSAAAGGMSVIAGELGGNSSSLHLIAGRGGLTDEQRARFPHLGGYVALHLEQADPAVLAEVLRGQVIVTERDADGRLLRTTGVQLPGVLDDLYAAEAAAVRLGPTFAGGRPTLAVWAPTARAVALELSDTPTAAVATVAMSRDDRTGVWSVTGDPDWTGRYYRYRVRVWQPAVQRLVSVPVTDPYSVALAADSTHSQIADLADPTLVPPGWSAAPRPVPVPPAASHIQEVSVRDFSIADPGVPAAERGTYLAFTHPDSAGMRHLRTLATAGVTHLHLLPTFDFATIPERRADQARPAGDLAALPPDSAEQQARIAAVADTDGYNWGYDPLHYTTPEGGYAVDPDGAARTREFRRMVAALHGVGLRVVLDVVYNHTMAAGLHPRSVLDRIVPGYYHRLLADGTVADSTCCSNTAPEHAMMGKLVVDSVLTWATAYRVDGFRFDLMGHHPRANILAVRAALDRLGVARDGVDGRSIYLYGEGWDFGEVAGGARFPQATQARLAGTGIGTFNDRFRDAVRGGAPFESSPRVQGFASGLFTDPNGDPGNGPPEQQRDKLLHLQDQIKVGLTGNLAGYRFVSAFGAPVSGAQIDNHGSPTGYAGAPGEAVTFVDAHDNEILYDALAYKLPQGTALPDRTRMQVLALSLVVLGQGVGFVTAGSERLRSKSLDRNSYDSGDWFNQIRWDCADGNGFGIGLPPAADNRDKWPYARPLLADPALVADCAAVELCCGRYLELLRVAASSPVFALGTLDEVQRRLSFPLSGVDETPGVVTMHLDGRGLDPRWASVTVVFNAVPSAVTQTVPALRGAALTPHPGQSPSVDAVLATAAFDPHSGTLAVPARSVAVFVQELTPPYPR